jgi:hypothetical protein
MNIVSLVNALPDGKHNPAVNKAALKLVPKYG